MTTGFQPMPDLSDDEYDALRADIAERGVLVPVVVDQYGRLLDGHHRQRIAAELGIDCPTETRQIEDDDHAHELALTLNVARRHLTREQRRQLITTEIERRPDDSDRSIARRCGCDHKTVGSVRRELGGETPHPAAADDPGAKDAAEFARSIRARLERTDGDIMLALRKGASRGEVVRALSSCQSDIEATNDPELIDAWWRLVIGPRIDAVYAWPDGGHYRHLALAAAEVAT